MLIYAPANSRTVRLVLTALTRVLCLLWVTYAPLLILAGQCHIIGHGLGSVPGLKERKVDVCKCFLKLLLIPVMSQVARPSSESCERQYPLSAKRSESLGLPV